MTLELVAGRLIARYLGASLYTWTTVIGVILMSICIGNYIGGYIADRLPSKKTLALLFGLSSVMCVGIISLNNLLGECECLWHLYFPLRVFIHVSLLFLFPSTLLGMTSPIVAKIALDQGLATGKTVGIIYAWGAAGSIAGTFITGYYLIVTIGTIAIIWVIAIVLLIIGILYWIRCWVLYMWAIILFILIITVTTPGTWAADLSSSLALNRQYDPRIIYEKESLYNRIVVRQIRKDPDVRIISPDSINGGNVIIMGNPEILHDSYLRIFAAVTHKFNRSNNLSTLSIGGGGYIYPRYIQKYWPRSHIDVVEIDSGFTEAAVQALGLQRDTMINIYSMDARNYIDGLLKQNIQNERRIRYDFIYEDAFGSYEVPYQLVTKEFNDKIYFLLSDDGIFLVNVIDTYSSGKFIGAFFNTIQQTFQHCYIVTTVCSSSQISNFVVVAAKQKLNIESFYMEYNTKIMKLWVLNSSEIDSLVKKAQGTILTDDFAPVENLLLPVARLMGKREREN